MTEPISDPMDEDENEPDFGQCTASHHRREGQRCQQPAIGEHGYCASHKFQDPEDTKHGRCTAYARSSGRRCRKPAIGPHGKCRFHGGKTPTKNENPNVGAPEGSANNLQHGVYADPLNLYRHLSDEERHWVDSPVHGYVDLLNLNIDDPRIERVLRACVHLYQSWSAEGRILEDGLSKETVVGVSDEGQPIITKAGHHLHQFSVQRDKQAQRLLKDLGAFDSSESSVTDLNGLSSDSYTIVTNSDSNVDTDD